MPSAATDANAALYERRNNVPEETKSTVSRASRAASNRDNMSQVSVMTPTISVRGRLNEAVDNGTSYGSVTYVTATTRNTALSTKA